MGWTSEGQGTGIARVLNLLCCPLLVWKTWEYLSWTWKPLITHVSDCQIQELDQITLGKSCRYLILANQLFFCPYGLKQNHDCNIESSTRVKTKVTVCRAQCNPH